MCHRVTLPTDALSALSSQCSPGIALSWRNKVTQGHTHFQSNLDPISAHCRDITAQIPTHNWGQCWKATPASELLGPVLPLSSPTAHPSPQLFLRVFSDEIPTHWFLSLSLFSRDLSLQEIMPGMVPDGNIKIGLGSQIKGSTAMGGGAYLHLEQACSGAATMPVHQWWTGMVYTSGRNAIGQMLGNIEKMRIFKENRSGWWLLETPDTLERQ